MPYSRCEASLSTRPMDGEALHGEWLKAHAFGEMLLERKRLEARMALLEAPRPKARLSFSSLGFPLGPLEAAAMSVSISPFTGKPHGTARVCRLDV